MLKAPLPEDAVSFTLGLEDGDFDCSLIALSAIESRPSNVKGVVKERVLCPDVKWRFVFSSNSMPVYLLSICYAIANRRLLLSQSVSVVSGSTSPEPGDC